MKNLNTDALYVGRITAADANYTYGSAKNETVGGAGDGSPYEKGRANDVLGLQQALLRLASIVPSGNADTQLVCEQLEAIVELASGRAINYDESGIANAYELDVRSGQQGPRSYFNDFYGEFTPANSNNGPSTINIHGNGVKNLFYKGVACAGGEIVASTKYGFKRDLANDRFDLIELPGIITPVSGYVGGTRRYSHNDSANATGFDVEAVIGAAWESVGPTGSGATNIWTALDDVPAGTPFITVKVNIGVFGNTTGIFSTELSCRVGGSATAASIRTVEAKAVFRGPTVDDREAQNVAHFDIPIDSDGVFDLYLAVAGTSSNCDMFLKGFDK